MIIDAVYYIVGALYSLDSIDGSEWHATNAMQIDALPGEVEILDFCKNGKLCQS